VKGAGLPPELVFKGEADELPPCHPSADWAAIALLYPAMLAGEDLEIEGPVSPVLYYNMRDELQRLLITFNPNLKYVNVIAEQRPSWGENSRVATGFSAGVDTFATLALFTGEEVPKSFRIDSLTTFDVGAMGNHANSEYIFQRYRKRLVHYAESNGFHWQAVRTNIDDFYNGRECNFRKTHTLRNAAAVHFLGEILSLYLYSSAFDYSDINHGNNDVAFIDPLLLPLLSSEKMKMKSAGAGLARIEKMRIIAAYEPCKTHLDVCVANPRIRNYNEKVNCSRCWKCSRAMVNLDVLNVLDHFYFVFNVADYREKKKKYLRILINNSKDGNPQDRDLLKLLRKKKSFSKWDFFTSYLISLAPKNIRKRFEV